MVKTSKEALPQGGKVMVFVGTPDAANAQQRFQGLKEAIAGSNIEILNVRTDNTDRVRAGKRRHAANTGHRRHGWTVVLLMDQQSSAPLRKQTKWVK